MEESDYAFNHELSSQRFPAQIVGRYPLPNMNLYQPRAATSTNFVGIGGVPRPTPDEQVIKGNVSFFIPVLMGRFRCF